MKAFIDKPITKDRFIEHLKWHQEQDRIAPGIYGDYFETQDEFRWIAVLSSALSSALSVGLSARLSASDSSVWSAVWSTHRASTSARRVLMNVDNKMGPTLDVEGAYGKYADKLIELIRTERAEG